MLLKQLGIDPKKIFAQAEALTKEITGQVTKVDARLSAIESTLSRIEAHLGIENPPQNLSIYTGGQNGHTRNNSGN